MVEFTQELCKMQEYCYFSKKCSHHRHSSMIFKNSCSRVTVTGNILGGVTFRHSCRQQIGQDKLRKRTQVKQFKPLKSISAEGFFLGMFQNFQKSSFSEHLLKKYNVENFLETWILNGIPVTLLNGFMIDLFLETFQNTNRKYLAWIPFLLKSHILDLNLQKRMFSIIFSKFENILSFLSNFEKVFVVEVLVGQQAVDSRFPKVLGADISKCPHENICDGVQYSFRLMSIMELLELLILQTCVKLAVDNRMHQTASKTDKKKGIQFCLWRKQR